MAKALLSDPSDFLTAYSYEPSFLARYRYYTAVLATVRPVIDPSVPFMTVSLHAGLTRNASYYLHVNPRELAREPRFLRGLLLHEVHHIVLGHLAHPKFFVPAERELMEIAQEVSANEYIDEPLPDPMLWQHFERFGLRAGQSTLERYHLLCKARAQGQTIAPKPGTTFVDAHLWQNALPPALALADTRTILMRICADDRQTPEVNAAPSVSLRLVGRTPEQLLLLLGGPEQAPERVLPWREALRMFVARTRAPLHTWTRPSRRFPTRIGEVPGRAYQHRPALRPNLIVAIDTSLSMSERELREVAQQLRPLSEHAQLFIVECDAAIARTYAFRGTIGEVQGRGGTDLRPVFDPAFLRSLEADGVVYFTDGDGPTPAHAPHLPVLWILTKPHEFRCPWGERAQLR